MLLSAPSVAPVGRRNFLPETIPLFALLGSTYRVTKTYIVGKRLDFPNHRLAPDEEASGERDQGFIYTHISTCLYVCRPVNLSLCIHECTRRFVQGVSFSRDTFFKQLVSGVAVSKSDRCRAGNAKPRIIGSRCD